MRCSVLLSRLSAIAASLLVVSSATADVKLPAIFSPAMVLQQKSDVAIWGWADAGEEVTVSLGETKVSGKGGADGKWLVKLKTPAAGGPFTLAVKGKNEINLPDVLVGEVWVCSGQSNMQWTVRQAENPEGEAKQANYPQIRMFSVQRNIADKPQDDCQGSWVVCSPETVSSFSAVGYFFGRELHKELQVPVGLINTSWGGTICEAWTCQEALGSEADLKHFAEKKVTIDTAKMNPNQPSVLFNAMINPLVPYGIKGAIWYQGESNRARAEQYRKLFPTMIADWRKHFEQGNFPFLFVQLAPFDYGNADPAELAEIWEAQTKTLTVSPNTGMAVTTDIGNIKDIHPKNKQEVGRRLALWALAKTYEKPDLVYSGPLYESMSVEGNKIRLKFQHTAGGLVAEGGKPLSHFTIAGDDHKFVPAKAEIDGETIVVSSPEVGKPVAVRFAWEDTAEPNLFNKANLPASPFRTDDLPLVTAGRK